MKKKPLLALLAVLLLSAALLNGCAGGNSSKQSANAQQQAAQVQQNTQAANLTEKETQKELQDKTKEAEQSNQQSNKQEENNANNAAVQVANTNTSSVSSSKKSSGKTVSLWITKDFGKSSLLKKEIILEKNWTVFDVLQSSAQLETAQGGGFITGINGLTAESGQKKAWMYYVNGIFANVGVLDYLPHLGDVIWWDYHKWESMSTFPAVIGSYPEPFLHGYKGKVKTTTILSLSENQELADKLKQVLKAKGVASVQCQDLAKNQSLTRTGPTIVLGEWKKLRQIKSLSELNAAYSKTGTCVHFTGKGLEIINSSNKVAKTLTKSAGAIVATGDGNGDEKPLWLVVGIDEAGLKQAVNILAGHPEKIKSCYQAAVSGGKVLSLPVQ
ncbi:DUF4430 domain-containing protein [Bacillota bacterium LX-D]|nr:DUF4430 domain-containing protein [Bacillota bacterium LX-D]